MTMGRPRKWASDAERKRTEREHSCPNTPVSDSKRTDKRTEIQPPSKRTVNEHSIWHPLISQDRFKGVGRGIPVDGYVLVSLKSEPNGDTEHGIVDVDTWHARLDKVCAHGLAGWSCKPCLPVYETRGKWLND